jgi:hypothetical protein
LKQKLYATVAERVVIGELPENAEKKVMDDHVSCKIIYSDDVEIFSIP